MSYFSSPARVSLHGMTGHDETAGGRLAVDRLHEGFIKRRENKTYFPSFFNP
jgi:hypothetical protein